MSKFKVGDTVYYAKRWRVTNGTIISKKTTTNLESNNELNEYVVKGLCSKDHLDDSNIFETESEAKDFLKSTIYENRKFYLKELIEMRKALNRMA